MAFLQSQEGQIKDLAEDIQEQPRESNPTSSNHDPEAGDIDVARIERIYRYAN